MAGELISARDAALLKRSMRFAAAPTFATAGAPGAAPKVRPPIDRTGRSVGLPCWMAAAEARKLLAPAVIVDCGFAVCVTLSFWPHTNAVIFHFGFVFHGESANVHGLS